MGGATQIRSQVGCPAAQTQGWGLRAKWAGFHVEEASLLGFWLSLSPLTPPGLLNFFLAAKFHPRRGVRALEGRGETWRKTQKERGVCCDPETPSMNPMRSCYPGTNAPPQDSVADAVPPEPMHQYPSGSSPVVPSVLPLIHFPKTQESGPRPPHSHLRTAPPRGRGSGPLPRRPRPQPRCPPTRRSCTARRAPSDGRGG